MQGQCERARSISDGPDSLPGCATVVIPDAAIEHEHLLEKSYLGRVFAEGFSLQQVLIMMKQLKTDRNTGSADPDESPGRIDDSSSQRLIRRVSIALDTVARVITKDPSIHPHPCVPRTWKSEHFVQNGPTEVRHEMDIDLIFDRPFIMPRTARINVPIADKSKRVYSFSPKSLIMSGAPGRVITEALALDSFDFAKRNAPYWQLDVTETAVLLKDEAMKMISNIKIERRQGIIEFRLGKVRKSHGGNPSLSPFFQSDFPRSIGFIIEYNDGLTFTPFIAIPQENDGTTEKPAYRPVLKIYKGIPFPAEKAFNCGSDRYVSIDDVMYAATMTDDEL